MQLNLKEVIDKVDEMIENVARHYKKRECAWCKTPTLHIKAMFTQKDVNMFQYSIACKSCKRTVGLIQHNPDGSWAVNFLLPDPPSFLHEVQKREEVLRNFLKPPIKR
jgi:hypothetical protein